MVQFVPVDHDPFAAAPPPAPIPDGVKLVPVDHDPFAPDRGALEAGTNQWANQTLAGFGPQVGGVIQGALDWSGLDAPPPAPPPKTVAELDAALKPQGAFTRGYNRFVDRANANLDTEAAQHPIASTVGGLAGGLTSVALGPEVAVGKAAQGAKLGAKIVRGLETGATYTAVAGAGNARGSLGDRAFAGLEGAVVGALTGGMLPVAGKVIATIGKPFTDMIRARLNPAGFAAQKVVDRMAAGGRSVGDAANRMADAAANGDSLSLADVGGEQLRRLGRTVVNTPGPGSTKLLTKVNNEAMAQGGRIGAKVDEGLAVPGLDYQDAKAVIMDARSGIGTLAAKPFYDAAYKIPVPLTGKLQEILRTPSGKAALSAAKTNAANLREPWAQSFPATEPDGTILKWTQVPNTRALDEVKRVLDRMVDAAKKPADGSPFGKPLATAESIAIQSVRDDLKNFLVANNKPYAEALAKGLDNIQADEALEFGRNILNTDARVVARRMGAGGRGRDRVFNEGQQELVRVAAADAIRLKLEKTDFTHNGLLKFFSSRDDLRRMRPLFRSAEDWQRFRTSMFNEVRKRSKYIALKGNSNTAQQLIDAQEAGQLGETVNTVAHAARGSVVSAAANVLVRVLRRMGGLTPEVGDQIARLISTKDIGQVQGIIRQMANIEASNASQAQRLSAARNLLTKALSASEGQALQPSQDAQAGAR